MRIVLALLLFIASYAPCVDYLYPALACKIDNIDTIIFMHQQQSPLHLSLIAYQPYSNRTFYILPHARTPGGLTLMPDGNKLSYIENGLLKLYSLYDGSSQIVPLDLTLYSPTSVCWVDNESAIVNAKKRGSYGLFYITINEQKTRSVVHALACDALYPSVTNDVLFYIERTTIPIKTGRGALHAYAIVALPINDQGNCMRIDWSGKEPIAFLYMHSPTEGFFIEHQSTVTSEHDLIECVYYHLYTQDHITWHTTRLFSFAIPAYYLIDQSSRLHEALLPLLPRHTTSGIYYCDVVYENDHEQIDIFCYDNKNEEITRITYKGNVIAPCKAGNDLWYGIIAKSPLKGPERILSELILPLS